MYDSTHKGACRTLHVYSAPARSPVSFLASKAYTVGLSPAYCIIPAAGSWGCSILHCSDSVRVYCLDMNSFFLLSVLQGNFPCGISRKDWRFSAALFPAAIRSECMMGMKLSV